MDRDDRGYFCHDISCHVEGCVFSQLRQAGATLLPMKSLQPSSNLDVHITAMAKARVGHCFGWKLFGMAGTPGLGGFSASKVVCSSSGPDGLAASSLKKKIILVAETMKPRCIGQPPVLRCHSIDSILLSGSGIEILEHLIQVIRDLLGHKLQQESFHEYL